MTGNTFRQLMSTLSQAESLNNGVQLPDDDNAAQGPIQVYEQKVVQGELRSDEKQLIVLEHFQKLDAELEKYRLHLESSNGFLSKITSVCSLVDSSFVQFIVLNIYLSPGIAS